MDYTTFKLKWFWLFISCAIFE